MICNWAQSRDGWAMARKSLFEPLAGIKAANSNTRIVLPGQGNMTARATSGKVGVVQADSGDNLGLTSERSRQHMVQRLREKGITDEDVLKAMGSVPRHQFVDQALASRAYEEAALPIGHGQTISQPWVVAHMLSILRRGGRFGKVLEVGGGCGYQAAVLAKLFRQVYSVERVRPLYDTARGRISVLGLRNAHFVYGDGMLGWKAQAPYDAIIVAAAGLAIPQSLLDRLEIGGRLIAPEGQTTQRLVLIIREDTQRWSRQELEAVRFVPLKPGVQT